MSDLALAVRVTSRIVAALCCDLAAFRLLRSVKRLLLP